MFESLVPAVDESLITQLVMETFVTSKPWMPLPPVSSMFIRSNDGLNVDVRLIPWLLVS